MNPRRCIIVDDEPLAIKVLESHFGQLPSWQVEATFTSASAAADHLHQYNADLLLLDIQMPGINGLSLLRSLPQQIPTILTTAHREYALEGYELNVVDYLMKPIGLDRLLTALAKLKPLPKPTTKVVQAVPTKAEQAYIYVKVDRQYVKINLAEVCYVEAIKNHLRIHCLEGRYMTLMPLCELEDKLPADRFMRCHRSFIVALHQIQRFDHANLYIEHHRIPIGRLYKQGILEQLNRFTL